MSMMCIKATTAANSSELSAIIGFAVALVASSFFSNLSIISMAPFISRCATNLCSCSRSNDCCWSNPACSFFISSKCSLISAASVIDADSLCAPFASLWRARSKFMPAWRDDCAAICAAPAFWHAFFMSSAFISTLLDNSLVAASASSTFFRTRSSVPTASLRTVAALLLAIPRFVSLNFLATSSRRSCSFVRTSPMDCLDTSPRRFAARRFIARNVLAPPTAVFAVAIAASRSSSALPTSSTGKSSPRKSGASALAIFSTLSSALFMRCSASP
mmetsp:Transcript_98282/g.277918  ORF Transcript_98282/g.277918 Transcript_98282/m.277918 type:complete len:274 (+) Transcript_98282:2695-3516(+)